MKRWAMCVLWVCVLGGAGDLRAGITDTRIPGPSTALAQSIPIPDNSANGVFISLPIEGVAYPIADVTLSLTLSHTWVGDLEAVLSSPSGTLIG